MTMVEVAPKTLKKVKEALDFIYELTITEDGYTGSLHKNGTRFSHIASILVKRGILVKGGPASSPNYKWFNPAMAPTKHLYKTVASEMVQREREMSRKSQEKKRKLEADAKEDEVPVEEPTPVVEPVVEPVEETTDEEEPVCRSTLSSFTVEELWAELKKRGCYIENNQLAIQRVEYLQ